MENYFTKKYNFLDNIDEIEDYLNTLLMLDPCGINTLFSLNNINVNKEINKYIKLNNILDLFNGLLATINHIIIIKYKENGMIEKFELKRIDEKCTRRNDVPVILPMSFR